MGRSDKTGMPLGVYLLFGVIAMVVVFAGIKLYKDNKAEAARIEAKAKADAEKAAADQKFWEEARLAAEKTMREQTDKVRSDLKKYEELSKKDFDFKNLKPQVPSSGWYPNQKYGGPQNLAPPGTVYEHRNGQMHQVR